MHFSAHMENGNYRNGRLHGDETREYRNASKLARCAETSGFDSNAGKNLSNLSKDLETAETQITLSELPVGARLIVQCKKDWRSAVVSKIDEEKVTLIVCSARGGTYRLRRALETSIVFDGEIPVLHNGCEDDWRGGFVKYDARW